MATSVSVSVVDVEVDVVPIRFVEEVTTDGTLQQVAVR